LKKRRKNNITIGVLILCSVLAGNLSASVKQNTSSYSENIFLASLPGLPSNLFGSADVDRLQSDVADFDKTLNTYITNGKKLDNDIQIVLKGLDLINTLAKNLKDLDDALTTVEKGIKIAQDIPQTAETANKLEKEMQSIHPQVTKASTSVNNLNDKISPTRNKLQSFDSKLQNAITAAETFENGLNKYTADIAKAQQCISSLPDGSTKDGLQSRLDKLANASDKRVVQANKLLKDIISVINAIDNKITQEIDKLMQPIDDLETDVASLLKDLKGIINPLKDLESLFSKSFSVTFPYPSPTWKHPFRMKNYTLDIGFDIILQGADKIKNEIEKKLGKTMYEAAKAFGLNKLVDDLEDQGKKALNPILKDLHLDINMNIPGIGQLDQNLNDLSKGLSDLSSMMTLDTQPLDGLFKDIQSDISEMENIYQNCKP